MQLKNTKRYKYIFLHVLSGYLVVRGAKKDTLHKDLTIFGSINELQMWSCSHDS